MRTVYTPTGRHLVVGVRDLGGLLGGSHGELAVEFLAGVMAAFTIYLRQRGSHE